jgi:hypothetical protein
VIGLGNRSMVNLHIDLIFVLLSINVTFTFYYLLFVLIKSECYIDGQKNKY